ncbi:hypothetical protein FA13DRAFT_1711958 [Coprinellus micaceus]|uniref:Uncharacterized protein n=1 Tax=Coprinellus micaceus TaxID=71717 RepID=A0A4Y7T3J3_COPMI|nr:hypothetical protein FA13DRAFT_1711958 [Coprinellus micaceus]
MTHLTALNPGIMTYIPNPAPQKVPIISYTIRAFPGSTVVNRTFDGVQFDVTRMGLCSLTPYTQITRVGMGDLAEVHDGFCETYAEIMRGGEHLHSVTEDHQIIASPALGLKQKAPRYTSRITFNNWGPAGLERVVVEINNNSSRTFVMRPHTSFYGTAPCEWGEDENEGESKDRSE